MIRSQIALIQREFWEHRAIYVTPIVIGLVISLMSVTGQVSISGSEHVDVALIGLSNLGEQARATAITAMMLAIFVLFVLAMTVLTVFYSLDSLYAERKDRSILFWRSIPVTDSENSIVETDNRALRYSAGHFCRNYSDPSFGWDHYEHLGWYSRG